MKKIALFIAFAIMAIACKPEEQIVPEVNVLSETSMTIPTEGGSFNVEFNTNVPWTASFKESCDWASISPAEGDAGEAGLRILVKSNDTPDLRMAIVVIKAQTAVGEITVSQLQKNALELVSEDNIAINGDAQEVKVTIAHNVPVEASFDVDWITLADTKAYQTSDLVFNVAENKTDAERVGHITLTTEDGLNAEVTVSQEVWVARLNVTPAVENQPAYFTGEGGTLSFVIDANIPYTVDKDADWLTMSNDGATYSFTAPAYSDVSDRTANVWVTKTGVDEDADGLDDALTLPLKQFGTSTVLWVKNTSEYSDMALGTSCRLAYKDGMLLVSTGAEVHALDAATGNYLQKVALPEGFAANSMVNDAAGNILVAATCEWGDGSNVFTVFKVSSLDEIANPTPVITYPNNSIWGAVVGNLRVYGDVNKDALITAFCGTTNYALTWTVTGGVIGDAVFYALPQRDIWMPENGFVAPLGTKVSDGMFYNGYGSSYAYAYCADAATDNTWTDVYAAFSTWESGPSAASVADVNGKKYMACLEHSFFPQWACPTYLYILDVTTPASPALYYNSYGIAIGIEALANAAGDVLMLPGDNCLMLYAMCNSQGVIEAIRVPVE